MKKLLIRPIKRLGVIAIMLLCLLLENLTVGAQCYEDFYVYQVSPYGQLCSPQYATIRAEYYYSGSYISGEFRWYTSNTDPNPVQTNSIYSDFGEGLTADYSLYAENGTTAWVSFYNYNTGCESYRTPYTFYISTTPYLYQDYALKCGYESAKVQLSSNVTGSTFQLYKLHEYYDPYYGNVQDYQIVQSNSTGYFEINDFDPATDAYKYFAKIYHPYSCATPYYYQLYFDITSTSPPSVSGNLSVAAGSGTTLTAIGTAATFRWYDAVGNLVNEGWNYITPSNLAPGTYAYQVRGVSWDGNCISDPASVTVTVSLPNITYTPLYTSSNFTKTIDLSKPVGTLAGAASVTASGGVAYSIPIYTPPGTNGIEPSVSVSYNSQAASGVAGWGWNIAGLSAISRTGKNIYHNGLVKPVTYTTDDAFLLDGMRLNVISGSNGANGSTYAGEAESFATITSFTTGSANNPGWFKVFAKDGSVMGFGNTLDSRVLTDNGTNVMLWRLNKIKDVNGNYIEFVYDNNLRDSRIKTIKYTGNLNAGLTPYNSINFKYKLRSDKNTGYDAGSSLSSSHLLDKIVVQAGTAVTKSYQFNYGFDNINSFLKEVVEVAGDDTTTLNFTIFLYGDQPQNLVAVSATNTNVLQGANDLFPGDFDGDGKTDIIAADKYYSNGYRFHTRLEAFCDLSEGSPYTLYFQNLGISRALSYIPGSPYNRGFQISDYNKDGRDDILISYTTVSTISSAESALMLSGFRINYSGTTQSTGNSGDLAITILPPSGGYQYSKNGKYLTSGDFDGDGNQDYIMTLSQYPTYSYPGYAAWSYNHKNFMSSLATNEFNKEILEIGPTTVDGNASDVFHMLRADYVLPMDFDGDGKQELLVTSGSKSGIISFQRVSVSTGYTFTDDVIYNTDLIKNGYKIFPGDFNGDRKTDFLVKNNNGVWNILYSTGTSFVSAPFYFNQTININGNNEDHLLLVSDFNGDGKTDIIHGFPVWVNGTSSSSKLSVYYGRGISTTSFFYEQYDYIKVLPFSPGGVSEGVIVGDFNGDGRNDFISKPSVSLNGAIDLISLKSFGKEKLLVKITDGHNITTTFNYKLLTDKSTYPYFYDRTISLDDPANQNPYNYVQLPLYAVSSVIVPDGIGGNNTTSYRYENAVVHRAAKGFLGFKKITSKNDVADITSTTENEINTEFAVPYTVKQTTKLTSTGVLLSESQITNSFVNLSTGYGDKRYLQKIDKTLSIDYLNGKASETVNTIDLYGNIIQTVSKNGTLSCTTVNALETSTTNASYSIHNTPVAAKPDNVTVTNSRTAMPSVTSTSTFTYNANGLLAAQTVFSGLPKAVTTSYSYDPYGNPLTAITSSTGLTNKTSTNTYDAKGRFLLSKQLSSGGITQTETFEYANDKWGKPTKIISNDCLTTSFEYDLFGRLKTTTLPQGFTVTNSIHWDVSGNNVSYAFTDYPGGNPDTKTWFDKLGRATKTQTAGFNNQWLTRLTTYNAKGQVATQTNDYYATETPLVTTNTYDAYGRMVSTANTLNTVTNTYTSLTNGEAQVVTTSSIGQTSTKISDATGKIIKALDNGGQLDFTFDSRGNQTEVKHGSNILVTSVYDSYGRQTSLTDKNAGTITYAYDAFGQLVQQTDVKSNTYTMLYDGLGRITNRTGAEGSTIYEYSTTACNNNGLTKITGFNGVIKEYTYDAYKRPATEKLTLDGIPYTTSFSYNQYNALTKTIYPSGIEENKTYDVNGELLAVTGGNPGSPVTLFTTGNVNGFRQYTSFTSGNGKTTQNTFYYGIPTRYYTPGVQDLNLTFDYTKGNLTNRNDAIKGISESFAFDNLNRLTSATVNGVQQFAMSYDGTTTSSMGNIVSKTDAGNYVYKTDKINAVAYITNPAGAQVPPSTISTIEQQASYTPFLKMASVTEAPYSLDFTYGPDYQRVKTLLKNNSALVETRLYIGSYEKQIIAGGATREVHYVSGGNGLCAILVKEGGIVTPYYVYTDHLGSLLTITNSAGTVVAEQNFDAWGRKRNPVNWQYAGVPTTPAWLYRGYTSHEHLPNFTLINMNGRMYDPVQGRMLSPDNYVATPFGTQGYIRYSYANNNPLSYVDPDGNNPLIIVGILVGGFLKGMQYDMSGKGTFLGGFWRGALVSGAGSALGVGLAGSFSSLGMVGGGIVQGGITGLATGGLGAALDGRSVFKGALFGGISGGIVGGVFGGIQRASIGDSDIPTPPGDTNTGEYFSSNDEIDAFINNNIGDVNAIESNFKTNITLASGNNLPPGYSFNNNTNMMYNVRKEMVGGSTQIKGGWFTSLKSKIFMSPGIKGYFYNGKNFSQVAISHEILHAYHYSAGLGNGINSESAASAYSLAYAKSYNMTTLFPIFRSQISNYPSVYSWQKLSRLINMGLKY